MRRGHLHGEFLLLLMVLGVFIGAVLPVIDATRQAISHGASFWSAVALGSVTAIVVGVVAVVVIFGILAGIGWMFERLFESKARKRKRKKLHANSIDLRWDKNSD